MTNILTFGLVVGYFVVILLVGWLTGRKETDSAFIIAERKVGLLQTTASMCAVIGGMLLVSQAALAYDLGWSAILLWAGLAFGMILLGFLAKKIKRVADKNHFLTIAEYVRKKFGRTAGVISAVIIFAAFFALLTGQFIAGGLLLSAIINITYPTAILILGIATLAYLLLGGFKAVVRTDLLQFLIMIGVFVGILIIGVRSDHVSSLTNNFAVDGFTGFLFLIMGPFIMFGSGDIFQRIFAAKDTKTARNASFLTAGIFFLFGVALTSLGVYAASAFPDIASGDALYYGLTTLFPHSISILGILLLLAAIMSTIDTEIFFLSSSVVRDFSKQIERSEKKRIRLSMLCIAIVSVALSIYVADILLLLFALLSLTLCVSPAIIASLFWRVNKFSAIASMIAGVCALILLALTGSFNPDTSILSLPAAIITLAIAELVTRIYSRFTSNAAAGNKIPR